MALDPEAATDAYDGPPEPDAWLFAVELPSPCAALPFFGYQNPRCARSRSVRGHLRARENGRTEQGEEPRVDRARDRGCVLHQRDRGRERGHDERDEVGGVVEVFLQSDLEHAVVGLGGFQDEVHDEPVIRGQRLVSKGGGERRQG